MARDRPRAAPQRTATGASEMKKRRRATCRGLRRCRGRRRGAPEPEPESANNGLAEFQAQQAANRSGLLGVKKTQRKVTGDDIGEAVFEKSIEADNAISTGTYGKKKREENRKVKRMVDIQVKVASKPKPSYGDER